MAPHRGQRALAGRAHAGSDDDSDHGVQHRSATAMLAAPRSTDRLPCHESRSRRTSRQQPEEVQITMCHCSWSDQRIQGRESQLCQN